MTIGRPSARGVAGTLEGPAPRVPGAGEPVPGTAEAAAEALPLGSTKTVWSSVLPQELNARLSASAAAAIMPLDTSILPLGSVIKSGAILSHDREDSPSW